MKGLNPIRIYIDCPTSKRSASRAERYLCEWVAAGKSFQLRLVHV